MAKRRRTACSKAQQKADSGTWASSTKDYFINHTPQRGTKVSKGYRQCMSSFTNAMSQPPTPQISRPPTLQPPPTTYPRFQGLNFFVQFLFAIPLLVCAGTAVTFTLCYKRPCSVRSFDDLLILLFFIAATFLLLCPLVELCLEFLGRFEYKKYLGIQIGKAALALAVVIPLAFHVDFEEGALLFVSLGCGFM